MGLRRRPLLASLALFGLPFLLYLPTLGFGLLGYDDARYYLVNGALRAPRGWLAVWTGPFYSDYMPVTQLGWWLDLALFGDRAWWGARLHSLAWLGAGTLAVRALVARVTGQRGLAFAVALLYAVHPVASHSVLWLAQRKGLVALALALWAAERYAAAREATLPRERWTRGAVSFALAVLALLAKAHAVAVPGMLLAWELARGRGSLRSRAAALAPFALAAVAFLLASLLWLRADLGQTPLGGGRAAALVASGTVALRYLLHTVAPFDLRLAPRLSFFYAVDEEPGAAALAAWAALAAVAAAATRLARDRASAAWAWLFGLAALLPALNLVPQPQPMADQYHLWALPGWLAAAALAAQRLVPGARAGAVLCACAALLFGAASVRRSAEYASAERLFEATVRHQPASSLAWSELARALLRSAEPSARERAGQAALEALSRGDAHRILPLDRPALAREAALALHRAGEAERARRLLDAELAGLPPDVAPLGEIERADFELRTGRPEAAAARLQPSFDSVPAQAVAALRSRCRSGRVLPHQLDPVLGLGLAGDDADRAFSRDAILRRLYLLASARRASGQPEQAFDAAALLVNLAPGHRDGRALLRSIYSDLGVLVDDELP